MNNKKKSIFCFTFIIVVILLIGSGVFLMKKVDRNKKIRNMNQPTIVVFGDSIWGMIKDDTGIAAYLEQELDATVYNCAIPGTSAALRSTLYKDADDETKQTMDIYDGKSLVSITNNLVNDNATEMDDEVATLVNDIPWKNVDYILLAYGLNDYFNAVPRDDDELKNPETYAGALRSSVEKLQQFCPNAQIVLLSQTYCQGYSYGKVDSESDYKDYGGGTGPDYVGTLEGVAEEYQLLFINNYEKMGINIHNGAQYLSDATHLTEKGRKKYAGITAKCLLASYENGNE